MSKKLFSNTINIMELNIEQQIIHKTEKINKQRAQWVLNNFDKITFRSQCDKLGNPTKDTVINYCKKVINSKDGLNNTMYTQSKLINIGRYFCKTSLQLIDRVIRHTLCKDDYIDVDIVNCQPTILLNYCKLNNIDCDKLEYYVENRTEIINKILENKLDLKYEDVKMDFITIINGGGIADYLKDDNFVKLFYYELKY